MTLIVDTAPIVALADRHDDRRGAVSRALQLERGRLIVPAPISAEIDYMLGSRVGRQARLSWLQDVANGDFEVQCLDFPEYQAIVTLENRYAALSPGLADLSIVVLAQRFNTRRVLTFDARHFRAITPLQGGQFEILPERRESEP